MLRRMTVKSGLRNSAVSKSAARPALESTPIHVVMGLSVDQNQRNALTFRSSRPSFSFAVLLAQDSFTAKRGGLTQTLGRQAQHQACPEEEPCNGETSD